MQTLITARDAEHHAAAGTDLNVSAARVLSRGRAMIAGRHTLTGLGLATTTSVPVIDSWPSPHSSEHTISHVPGSEATNSIVTGLPPRESGC